MNSNVNAFCRYIYINTKLPQMLVMLVKAKENVSKSKGIC